MGMTQALMQILEKHIFGCRKIASSSFLPVPLCQTNVNPCFVSPSLFCQKWAEKRLKGYCVCSLTSITILTVQGQRWGLTRIHQWCSDNDPVLGMVFHTLPCLFDMLMVVTIRDLVADAKDYISPPVKSGEAVSDLN